MELVCFFFIQIWTYVLYTYFFFIHLKHPSVVQSSLLGDRSWWLAMVKKCSIYKYYTNNTSASTLKNWHLNITAWAETSSRFSHSSLFCARWVHIIPETHTILFLQHLFCRPLLHVYKWPVIILLPSYMSCPSPLQPSCTLARHVDPPPLISQRSLLVVPRILLLTCGQFSLIYSQEGLKMLVIVVPAGSHNFQV